MHQSHIKKNRFSLLVSVTSRFCALREKGEGLKNTWKLVVGVALLAALYYLIGITTVIEKIASVNLFFVALAAALLIASLAVSGLNVQIAARPFKKIPFLKSVSYYFFSWAIGFLSPGKIGEFSIIPLLQREGLTAGEATASTVLNKIITLLVLLSLSAVGLLLFFGASDALQISVGGLAVLVALVFLFWTERGRNWIKKIVGKKSAWFAGFGTAIDGYFSKHLDVVAGNLLVTVAQWGILAIFTIALFWGFGFYPDFWDVLFVASISSAVSLIPISPNGIGVREVVYTFLASMRGWPAVTTVGVITVSLAIHYAIVAIVLVFFAKEVRNLAIMEN